MADEVTKKDLQSLQGYVNAKIAALAKVIKEGGSDAAIKELQSFQKWVEGPLFDRIGRIDQAARRGSQRSSGWVIAAHSMSSSALRSSDC